MRLIICVRIMAKISEFYEHTFKQKSFRDILWYVRLVVIFIISLLIAFLTNLYIYTFMNQTVFIIAIIVTCLMSYYLSYRIVEKEYRLLRNIRLTTNKYTYIYLLLEASFLAVIFIILLLIIQSYYLI